MEKTALQGQSRPVSNEVAREEAVLGGWQRARTGAGSWKHSIAPLPTKPDQLRDHLGVLHFPHAAIIPSPGYPGLAPEGGVSGHSFIAKPWGYLFQLLPTYFPVVRSI